MTLLVGGVSTCFFKSDRVSFCVPLVCVFSPKLACLPPFLSRDTHPWAAPFWVAACLFKKAGLHFLSWGSQKVETWRGGLPPSPARAIDARPLESLPVSRGVPGFRCGCPTTSAWPRSSWRSSLVTRSEVGK